MKGPGRVIKFFPLSTHHRPLGVLGREDGGERNVFVDRPTIFGHRAITPLEHQMDAPAPALDELDGSRVLHALGALAVDLQDFVTDLRRK